MTLKREMCQQHLYLIEHSVNIVECCSRTEYNMQYKLYRTTANNCCVRVEGLAREKWRTYLFLNAPCHLVMVIVRFEHLNSNIATLALMSCPESAYLLQWLR